MGWRCSFGLTFCLITFSAQCFLYLPTGERDATDTGRGGFRLSEGSCTKTCGDGLSAGRSCKGRDLRNEFNQSQL